MKKFELSIEINSPKEEVWKILTDFKNFKTWNTIVPKGEGSLVERNTLELKLKLNSGRLKPFSCKVEKVRRRKYFLLSKKLGSKKLLYMKHYFYLEEMENNGTRVTQKWEVQGIIPKLFWKQISNGISAFKIMNEDLKKASESLNI